MLQSPLLFWLAVATLVLWVGAAAWIAVGVRSIRFLRDLPLPGAADRLPRLSVVIAARDEADAVEQALGSVLSQQYPDFEVVVVDDRSSDGTGAILDRMAEREPRLRVVHVDAVPAGWLGKNHALHLGAQGATGELILFTDADVVLERSALLRGAALVERERLDHLAVAPEVHVPGYWASVLVGYFSLGFSMAIRPWRVRNPRTREHVGIGAFNLVRASAYRAIDGHARIAMRPDDDMRLGKALKSAGFRPDVALGVGMVSVDWYPGLGAMVRGLEKNTFAGFGYSLAAVTAAVVAQLALNVWPWVALAVTGGATRLLNAATIGCILLAWQANRPAAGIGLRQALAHPVGALLFAYTLLRSTVLTLRQGGIRWRDTHYPLEALRANRPATLPGEGAGEGVASERRLFPRP